MNRLKLWLSNAGAWGIILFVLLIFTAIILGPYIIAAHFIHKYW